MDLISWLSLWCLGFLGLVDAVILVILFNRWEDRKLRERRDRRWEEDRVHRAYYVANQKRWESESIKICEWCGIEEPDGIRLVHSGQPIIRWPEWDEMDKKWLVFHHVHMGAQFQLPGLKGDELMTFKNSPEIGFLC